MDVSVAEDSPPPQQSSLSVQELQDPTPDVHHLFQTFNNQFFESRLTVVSVSWSARMTLCAGLCTFNGQMCAIHLSAPLLQLRPRSDLINTLLHEMIHAFLFLTSNTRDREGHGEQFCYHMNRINNSAGSHITVFHSFFDEVRYYQRFVWRCNGSCRFRSPYFGYVRRSMNRAPGKNDNWWSEHARSCGGHFLALESPVAARSTMKRKKRKNEIPPRISDSKQPTLDHYVIDSGAVPQLLDSVAGSPKRKRKTKAAPEESSEPSSLDRKRPRSSCPSSSVAVGSGAPNATNSLDGGVEAGKRSTSILDGMLDPYYVLEARRRRADGQLRTKEHPAGDDDIVVVID